MDQVGVWESDIMLHRHLSAFPRQWSMHRHCHCMAPPSYGKRLRLNRKDLLYHFDWPFSQASWATVNQALEVFHHGSQAAMNTWLSQFLCNLAAYLLLGIWLSISLFTFISISTFILKTFSLFLGNVICLETVLQLFTNHCFIQNCYVKLATERKLRGVSTYLPIPEALCSKHVWNTRSATTNSSPRPRLSGGQEYIPMSLFDS